MALLLGVFPLEISKASWYCAVFIVLKVKRATGNPTIVYLRIAVCNANDCISCYGSHKFLCSVGGIVVRHSKRLQKLCISKQQEQTKLAGCITAWVLVICVSYGDRGYDVEAKLSIILDTSALSVV